MTRAQWWPIGVVAVLVVTVGANLAMLRAASTPDGLATESDYYRKAVAWDSTLALESRSAATGWTAEARIERVSRGLALEVRLADRSGAPLEGAAVEVEAIHNLEAERPSLLVLAPRHAGIYRAAMASARAGLWELRIRARRGAEVFVSDLRREAPPRAGG